MEHSVIFIILGVMTVIVGMGPIMGIMSGFADTASQDVGQAFFEQLTGTVENQCRQMEDYTTVVSSAVEGELRGEEIELSGSELVLQTEDGDTRRSYTFDCDHDIELEVEGSSQNVIPPGSHQAIVSADTSEMEVTIEVEE